VRLRFRIGGSPGGGIDGGGAPTSLLLRTNDRRKRRDFDPRILARGPAEPAQLGQKLFTEAHRRRQAPIGAAS